MGTRLYQVHATVVGVGETDSQEPSLWLSANGERAWPIPADYQLMRESKIKIGDQVVITVDYKEV